MIHLHLFTAMISFSDFGSCCKMIRMTNISTADLSGIYHYEQLADWLGTSGQPRADQFALIAEAGYQLVVNLALPSSDNAISDEGSIVSGAGMAYAHIPVSFESPRVEDLRRFFGVLDAYSDSKVWVHCVVNARVSVFCYHYLTKRRGLSASEAKTTLLERWEPEMDSVWRGFLALSEVETPGALR